jgi:hypothetical protein
LSNDSDPLFVAEFYKNLKILSQDLFRKSVVVDNQIPPRLERRLSSTGARRNSYRFTPQQGAALEGLSAAAADDDTEYFATEKLSERLKQYAVEGGIPLEFVQRYTEQAEGIRQGTTSIVPSSSKR